MHSNSLISYKYSQASYELVLKAMFSLDLINFCFHENEFYLKCISTELNRVNIK